jgi:tetratricopeptide (TPR) repeat protein
MQNLTARYNYIYNSNVILTGHQQELTENYADNYDQVLPVYLGPEADNTTAGSSLNLKPMDDISKKAQVIILEKSYSNYLDDAYILLGKANFFNGNYFNAVEYFDYTIKTYKKNTNSYLEALNWKARSLMQLKRISEANQVLDTLEALIPTIKSKKRLAASLATLAQMCIYQKNNTAAISYLKDAVKNATQSQDRIRWTYILAQLYEGQKNYKNASLNYRKVERSNAPFEMYFNANLNQIKLKTFLGDVRLSNKDELLSLLKDDKNVDYNDQVYFQVAESHADREEYEESQKFYLLSIQKSTTNQYQKGLSYLRVADLNFKQFKDYLKAKSYYDSTVNTLPKSYPGYDLILKKNQNLRYLTNRFETIALEDTLQYISRQPEAIRASLIDALTNPVTEIPAQTINNTPSSFNFPGNYGTNPTNKTQPQNSFYFSNPAAISIGFNDFKKRWGSRKLENNWRQSIRSSAQETTQDIVNNASSTPVNPDEAVSVIKDKATLVKQYTDALPVTPNLLAQSNQKIVDAYYDIASFYLQELEDTKEAEEIYLILLKRFPQNNHLAAVYYSMFLINKGSNEARSNEYKNKVLTDFPASLYAKTILSPSFSTKQSELETAVNKKYNEIFDQYEKKAFSNVIKQVNENTSIGQNLLSPQFAYLKAIAIGRTSHVNNLIISLETIITQFPDDKLITPLVKEHLTYITAHIEDFKKRKIALIDFDPNEPPFIEKANTVPVIVKTIQNQSGQITAPNNVPDLSKATPAPAVKVDGPFSTAKSAIYYYVVDVADASLRLSSSRFGIGQFNRGNYSGSGLKHQLKEFDNDQLIYVGNFSNFEDAKSYSNGITPQLKQIMKVPVNVYTNFIISKENFDKLTSKSLLNKYIEFYKNNY